MAYETKVILLAIAEIMRKSDNLEDAYESLREIANAENVVLKSFHREEDKEKKQVTK
jgi:hypothetical protein